MRYAYNEKRETTHDGRNKTTKPKKQKQQKQQQKKKTGKRKHIFLGDTRSVMVMVIENGHGDTSSNPGRD